MYKGTTPTYLFTTEAEIDLTRASEVYVTFSTLSKRELFTKSGNDLYIEPQRVGVYLTQEETLSLPNERIQAQLNWTYGNKRMCSQAMLINIKANLLNRVI